MLLVRWVLGGRGVATYRDLGLLGFEWVAGKGVLLAMGVLAGMGSGSGL